MNSSSPPQPKGRRSKQGGLAVVVLVGLYSLAAPYINDRYGLNLPALRADAQGTVQVVESDSPSPVAANSQRPSASEKPADKLSPSQPPTTDSSATKSPSNRSQTPGPLSVRMRSPPTRTSKSISTKTSIDSSNDRLYGLLREVSPNRYISPAGLVYAPGSAEGHRLEHLRRHTKDDPGRPGSHGVFDGEMEGALKTIDRAYERAKKEQHTTKKQDRRRMIYTVDMGGRVGYVGGRDGNRKRKPMARRVRLVVEDDRLITAYPM